GVGHRRRRRDLPGVLRRRAQHPQRHVRLALPGAAGVGGEQLGRDVARGRGGVRGDQQVGARLPAMQRELELHTSVSWSSSAMSARVTMRAAIAYSTSRMWWLVAYDR